MYITRLASNEMFSPSGKIYREVGRAKDLSAPLCTIHIFIGPAEFSIQEVLNVHDTWVCCVYPCR